MHDEQKHLNSYIHRILETLRREDRSFTYQELQKELGINILANQLLCRALKNNPKIEIDRNMLRFVPLYNIRTVEDLRSVLLGAAANEGIEIFKLVDSPVDVQPFVEKLINDGDILTLKDLDGSEILFYNKYPGIRSASDEIRELWASVKIPSYHDIMEELGTAGIQSEYGQVLKKRLIKRKETRKRSQRRVKITNTHVKGLDLNGMNESD
ncbi:transcription initiation factor TFIIE subunit beta [Pancytospora epiphaga]|nr:transcription initiation factor TFIIE subunit beta [Pancytospora epiphaga]